MEYEMFYPGDIVEYCGHHAVVVADWDSQVEVDCEDSIQTWYKIFEGVPVTLVTRAVTA